MIMEMVSYVLMIIGSLISLIGSFGLIRFPDVYSRSHAQTLTAVGGVCVILIGALLRYPPSTTTAKIVFLIIFIFMTSPTATHAIIKAAYKSGIKPKVKKDEWLKSLKKNK